jgi:AhpD family alkylhydroperoxidase
MSITSNLIKEEFIMAKNPRELLNDFMGGLQGLGQTNGEQVNAFMNLLGAAYKPGAVDTKTKELISVAIGAYNRCEYCIVFHVYKALEAGATREEIMEAAMVAVAFGGGPSVAYSVTLLKDSIDEFEKDFK